MLRTTFFFSLFITATIGFNVNASWKYLHYAYAAYDTISTWNVNCRYCSVSPKFVVTQSCLNSTGPHNSFAYTGYNPADQEIIVSFRGSDNIPNWIADLEFFKTPKGEAFPSIPELQVERGFRNYFLSLNDCIFPEVINLQKTFPNYPTIVVGHSLGGAAANLFSMNMFINMRLQVSNLYTFGEPRTGNYAYSQTVQQYLPKAERMVNGKDCVVHLPLGPSGAGYHHHATEIWENPARGSTYKVCSSTDGEDHNCSWQVYVPNCADHTTYMNLKDQTNYAF